MSETGNVPHTAPPSEWLTYKAAGGRLGLRPGAVAARARRDRWPMRRRSDTGEPEVEVPGVLLAADIAVIELEPDQELRERIARAQLALLVRGGCSLYPDAYLLTVVDRAIVAELPKLPKR